MEVSHEALIREWERLAAWLHEARDDVRLQHTVSADAATWMRRGQPVDALYRGTVLAEAQVWAGRNTPSTQEIAFLAAGAAEGHRQETADRVRQAHDLAMARLAASRLRVLAGGLALFLLVAAALTIVAVHNAQVATVATSTAVSERNQALASAAAARLARTQAVSERNTALATLSRELAAQAVTLLPDQPQLALLLSVEAADWAVRRRPMAACCASWRPTRGCARFSLGRPPL